MAKRKKLVPPSADELAALEEGFARETTVAKPGLAAPIAQVAADAAAHATPGTASDRAAAAADAKDAAAYRAAVESGQVIRDVPLDEIATDQLTRDRMTMDGDALDRRCRWLFPALYFAVFPLLILVLATMREGS